ncbi:uncharacterized protein LOC126348855 [Schistocerca gregaria]|uniref:uncharacterized protein LOC126348855 n=1 Tax=Schistocerca gregaria TaxID=7010 RepID=UPI00211EA932|nr:uncharacterized protein LOC126348855 [Schistocerca gregaria]
MAQVSLRKCALLMTLAATVALAIPTEEKKAAVEAAKAEPEAAADRPLVGVPLAYDVSGDHSRSFLNPPPCHEGLCPFIKKVIPDAYYKDHDGHDDEHDHPAPSLCGNMCDNDLVCPIGQRCCATNCGYVCHPVVAVAPPAMQSG